MVDEVRQGASGTVEKLMLKIGRGKPLTLFAPGGEGDNLAQRMRYARSVKGTTIGFAYEQSGHFEEFRHLRRQAERDAAEVRAVADEHGASRAVGFSRGARAVVGALAEGPDLFERIVLVIPPGGQPAGRYSSWLESLSTGGREDLRADILVIANRGDQDHPARIAQVWAEHLGAELEVLPSRAVYTDVDRVASLIAGFLD